MDTTTESDFRQHLLTYFNHVTKDHRPLTIVRNGHPNAVLLAASTYRNLRENQFVLGNPTNLAYLRKSKHQLERGQVPHPDSPNDY